MSHQSVHLAVTGRPCLVLAGEMLYQIPHSRIISGCIFMVVMVEIRTIKIITLYFDMYASYQIRENDLYSESFNRDIIRILTLRPKQKRTSQTHPISFTIQRNRFRQCHTRDSDVE